MRNRAGYYRKNLSGEAEYSSFVPSPLPPEPPLLMTEETISMLVRASKNIASLEAMAESIPSMPLFVSMYVRKEALLSSQIEGTQATLDDILDPSLDKNANADVAEVINYVKAIYYAIDRLKTLPLCGRLIRETHRVLMDNVRGQEKSPGEFRHSQIWIGGQGSLLKNARYIPPNTEDMRQAMSDLEEYINADDGTDFLIKAALIHYQFETIHPFLDGNGRIGRLLIILFLIEKKVLSSPALYISYFLKKNRIEYYDRMSEVRVRGDYEQWVRFFLSALSTTAEDGIATVKQLSALHEKNTSIIQGMGRARGNVMRVFNYLESSPIVEAGKTAEDLGISFNTALSAIKKLSSAGILIQKNTAARNRLFLYDAYLAVLRRE